MLKNCARRGKPRPGAVVSGLAKAGIEVDRKVLSELAITEPAAFGVLAEKAKAALPA